MGTVTADAILSSEKSDEMHGVSCLTNTYCELGAVMFLTPLMAVFNLPSSPDLDDLSETRTADYKNMGYQALQLIALEVVLSFVTTFAHISFPRHRPRARVPASRTEHAADAKTRPLARVFTYRFWVYALMSVFFSMCVVGTVLGTCGSTACPRVRRSDGHVYFSFANRKRGNTSGGAPSKGGVSSPCTSTGPRGNRPIPSTRATRRRTRMRGRTRRECRGAIRGFHGVAGRRSSPMRIDSRRVGTCSSPRTPVRLRSLRNHRRFRASRAAPASFRILLPIGGSLSPLSSSFSSRRSTGR